MRRYRESTGSVEGIMDPLTWDLCSGSAIRRGEVTKPRGTRVTRALQRQFDEL